MYVVTKLKSQVTTNNKALKICLGIKGELLTYWFSIFFSWHMYELPKSARWNKKIWPHNSKLQMRQHSHVWLVSLPRSRRNKNGDRMSTSEQMWYNFPVWLNGDHPTMAESKVTRQICIYMFGDCCDSSYTILVKRCSSYYIYRLFFLGVCNTRYCSTD